MFVPTKMDIGELAIAVLPGVQTTHGMDHIKAVKGEIVEIKKLKQSSTSKYEYSVSIKYQDSTYDWMTGQTYGHGKWKILKILEYRIVKYTFGGIWQPNSEFDLPRIEKEEGVKIDPSVFHWI